MMPGHSVCAQWRSVIRAAVKRADGSELGDLCDDYQFTVHHA
jgi:hypothetical protein